MGLKWLLEEGLGLLLELEKLIDQKIIVLWLLYYFMELQMSDTLPKYVNKRMRHYENLLGGTVKAFPPPTE